MKIKCIDNDQVEKCLTIGEIYDIDQSYADHDKYFYITNDCGDSGGWAKHRFEVVDEQADKGFVLALTDDEKETLFLVMGLCSGDPVNSLRIHTQTIYDKLKYECNTTNGLSKLIDHISDNPKLRTIHFKDFPKTPKQIEIETLKKTIADAKQRLNELLT